MLKKSITYTNYNGEKITEDFYFNLSKAELVEMELSEEDGLSDALKRLVAANDRPKIISEFKRIILSAYGEKSLDGKRFIKTQELRDAFSQTEAYSELFVELATVDGAAANFINALVPADMTIEVPLTSEDSPSEEDTRPAWIREDRDPTATELQGMSKEELAEAFRRKASK